MRRYRLWIGGLVCAFGVYAIHSFVSPTLYVSEYGNDHNPGTKTHPLRTIQRGVDLLTFGGTLRIFPGRYRESVDISNHEGLMLPLRIQGDSEGVEIVGSEPSSQMNWQECTITTCPAIASGIRANVFVTSIDWTEIPTLITQTLPNQENRLLLVARSPNFNVTDPSKYHEHWWQTGSPQTSQTTIRDPAHIPALPDITGARTIMMDGQDRCGTFLYYRSIVGHNPRSSTFVVDAPIGAVTYDRQEIGLNEYSKYFIENAPGLLDSPGEWFYDNTNRRLYLWPLEQGNPNTLPIEIGRRNTGLRINRSNVFVDGIRMSNINDSQYYSSFTGGIVLDPSDTINNIYLSHLSFKHAGSGITAETRNGAYMRNIRITSSTFDHMGKSAISLIGDTRKETSIHGVTIKKVRISHSGFLINESAINAIRVGNIQVSDTIINDVASSGIHVSGFEKLPQTVDGVVISRNTVRRACQNGSGCSAIKLFGGSFSHAYITGNTVSDNLGWSFCQGMTQPESGYAIGIFISNASGISVMNNRSSNNSGPAYLAFTRQLPAVNNLFSRNTADHSLVGIALDGDTGDSDTDKKANETRHNDSTISYNTFIQNTTAVRLDPENPKKIRVFGNIYDNNALALIYGDTQIATPSAIHLQFPFWER